MRLHATWIGLGSLGSVIDKRTSVGADTGADAGADVGADMSAGFAKIRLRILQTSTNLLSGESARCLLQLASLEICYWSNELH
jgi:hypothetical protein